MKDAMSEEALAMRHGMADQGGTEIKSESNISELVTEMQKRIAFLTKHGKVKSIPIDPKNIFQMILLSAKGSKIRFEGMPKDAIYITDFVNPMTQQVEIFVAHESFGEVPEVEEPPVLELMVHVEK